MGSYSEIFAMSDEEESYCCSKKSDDYHGDVRGKESGNALSEHVEDQVYNERGLDFKTYIFLICHCPNASLWDLLARTEGFVFNDILIGVPAEGFSEISHYYHENVSMVNLCRLHGWAIREYPRQGFDAVLLSNEVENAGKYKFLLPGNCLRENEQ
ncbi:hypothetical protein QQ045_020288 [Rhodiola kirilowii]